MVTRQKSHLLLMRHLPTGFFTKCGLSIPGVKYSLANAASSRAL